MVDRRLLIERVSMSNFELFTKPLFSSRFVEHYCLVKKNSANANFIFALISASKAHAVTKLPIVSSGFVIAILSKLFRLLPTIQYGKILNFANHKKTVEKVVQEGSTV